MMIIPLISSINGFLQTLLIANKEAFKKYNNLILLQTILQILLSLLIFYYSDLSFYSFILGQALSSIIISISIFNLTRITLKIPYNFNLALFINLFVSFIIAAILYIFFGELIEGNILIAILIFIISYLFNIFLNVSYIIPSSSRNEFLNFAKIRLNRF